MSLKEAELSHQGTARDSETAALYDDVEFLIDIAGRLFRAIERQIRFVEVSLAVAPDDNPRSTIVLKEQLIRIAASLNVSLEEFAVRLEERTDRTSLWAGDQDNDESSTRHQSIAG
jgi:hypothetical protein